MHHFYLACQHPSNTNTDPISGWLPVRTSLVIQDQGLQLAGKEEDTHNADLKNTFSTEMGGLAREMAAVGQRLEHLETSVAESMG